MQLAGACPLAIGGSRNCKNAIYEAVLKSGRDQMQALPVGVERDRAVVEVSVQFTFDWPGVSALVNRIVDTEDDIDPELAEMGPILYAAPGIDMQTVDVERVARVTGAFCGLGMTALQAVRLDLRREWRAHILAAAMEALDCH